MNNILANQFAVLHIGKRYANLHPLSGRQSVWASALDDALRDGTASLSNVPGGYVLCAAEVRGGLCFELSQAGGQILFGIVCASKTAITPLWSAITRGRQTISSPPEIPFLASRLDVSSDVAPAWLVDLELAVANRWIAKQEGFIADGDEMADLVQRCIRSTLVAPLAQVAA